MNLPGTHFYDRHNYPIKCELYLIGGGMCAPPKAGIVVTLPILADQDGRQL